MSYHDALGPIAALARALGIRTAVGTPMLVDDRIWGALVAGWTQPHEISSETVERITEITELVATAIANAESRSAHFGA
jgi:GAF domain-containing protein